MRVEEFSLGFGPLSGQPAGRRDGLRHIRGAPGRLRAGDGHAQGGVRAASGGGAGGRRLRRRAPKTPGAVPRTPRTAWPAARALSADEIAATPLAKRYYSHPFWHKLLFIIAGVTMNMIVAFLLIWIVGASQGEGIYGHGRRGGWGRYAGRRGGRPGWGPHREHRRQDHRQLGRCARPDPHQSWRDGRLWWSSERA